MSAGFVSQGVNHIYIQHYNNNIPSQVMGLGIASRGVRRRIEPIWEPAQHDASGQGNVEATFQGVSGVISYDCSIHDDDVLKRAKIPLPNLTLVDGYIPSGGIGSFLRQQKNYFRVLLWRPYAQALGLDPFINFPICRLGNVEEIEGGQEKRVPMVWIVHTPLNYCAAGNGTFYNYDGSGWPGAIDCVA